MCVYVSVCLRMYMSSCMSTVTTSLQCAYVCYSNYVYAICVYIRTRARICTLDGYNVQKLLHVYVSAMCVCMSVLIPCTVPTVCTVSEPTHTCSAQLCVHAISTCIQFLWSTLLPSCTVHTGTHIKHSLGRTTACSRLPSPADTAQHPCCRHANACTQSKWGEPKHTPKWIMGSQLWCNCQRQQRSHPGHCN